MKTDINKNIFNVDNTIKRNVFFLITGIIIVIMAIILYYVNYIKIDIKQLLGMI